MSLEDNKAILFLIKELKDASHYQGYCEGLDTLATHAHQAPSPKEIKAAAKEVKELHKRLVDLINGS